MKLTELFQNLIDYNHPDIEEITISGRTYKTMPDAKPAYFISQGFGASRKHNSYNATLAQAVVDADSFFGQKPIIAQIEIDEFLPQEIRKRSDYCVIGEVHKDKEARVISKVHTHEVIQNAKDIIGYCKEDILLFAHNAHYKRVSEIAKHSGINGKPFLRTPVTWVPNDPQPFVRSQLIWAGLEISARIRDKYIYKVI